jgi:adenine-specific DNA methylase
VENIFKRNVQLVTCQSIAYDEVSDKNYLEGYYRTFEETETDLKAELDKGNFVIVGLLDTNDKAQIDLGHVVTLTKAFHDPVTGKLKFLLADSDNDSSNLVSKDANKLIPRIHHASVSTDRARPILQKIARLPGILVPDEHDEKKYKIPTILKTTKIELPNPFRKC